MKINLSSHQNTGSINVALRCPNCGHHGTFIPVGTDIFVPSEQIIIGQRKCPNTKCNGHLFIIANSSGSILKTYPSETIPFDKTGIPDRILSAFNEAIVCHSNSCFVASAIMIRKTLEEICDFEKSVGKNLSERLKALGTKILIPKELIEGMNELRLLGNDAAHIEANTFEQIGKDEIEISIEFTKEILKATYQYEDLLSKLRSLKKQS